MGKSGFQEFIENIVLSSLSILKIFILSKPVKGFSKIKTNSSSCVIIGNGPSAEHILSTKEDFFFDKDLFCVNSFPTTKYFSKYKPLHYINYAPEDWINNVSEEKIQQRNFLFNSIKEKTTWDLNFFIPHNAAKYQYWQKIILENTNVKIKYSNPTPIDGFMKFCHMVFKKNLGMPRPHNVLIPAIMLAINLGYKKIFLIGVEHSWLQYIHVSSDNRVLINQKHFYDIKQSVPKPMRKKGIGERKLHEVLIKFVYAFRGYFILNEYAQKSGAKIYNTTKDSYIDAFEKIEI